MTEQPHRRETIFRDQDLRGAQFERVDLTGSRFDKTNLRDVEMRGVELVDVQITGLIDNVVINGVDVVPLVIAEMDRQDPDRVKMRPTGPAGYREAWALARRRWDETLVRARRLDPELLQESVDGEWSFIETLRHLVFVTDSWVGRVILGDPSPWHPWALPFDEMPDTPGVPRDRAVRPTLDEVLAVRAERQVMMSRVIDDLDQEQLDVMTTPVDAPGWPSSDSFHVNECLMIVLNEEWEHRRIAERDLEVLEQRGGTPA